jgi:hypothetical protein
MLTHQPIPKIGQAYERYFTNNSFFLQEKNLTLGDWPIISNFQYCKVGKEVPVKLGKTGNLRVFLSYGKAICEDYG